MKNYLIKIFLMFLIASITYPVCAQSPKFITLKDGSTLKGQVLQLDQGVYTLATTSLGQIEIPESDILSITSTEIPQNTTKTLDLNNLPKTQFTNQMQKIQSNLFSNPQMMQEVQGLLQDKEITNILSDKSFMNDIMSQDPTRIEQNEKLQELIQNPKMKALIEKLKPSL